MTIGKTWKMGKRLGLEDDRQKTMEEIKEEEQEEEKRREEGEREPEA